MTTKYPIVATINNVLWPENTSLPDVKKFANLLATTLEQDSIQVRCGEFPDSPWMSPKQAVLKKLALSDIDGVLFQVNDSIIRVVQASTGYFIRIACSQLSLSEQLANLPTHVMQILEMLNKAKLIDCVGPSIYLERLEAVQPLPPGSPHNMPLGTTWWLMDEHYELKFRNKNSLFEKLKVIDLPQNLSRKRIGTYWIFNWFENPINDLSYAISQGKQHHWAIQQGLVCPASGFLKTGDKRIQTSLKSDIANLVFYDKLSHIASMSLPLTLENMFIPKDILTEINIILNTKETSSKIQVSILYMIVPERDVAMELYKNLPHPDLHVIFPNEAPQGLFDPCPKAETRAAWLHELDLNYPRFDID